MFSEERLQYESWLINTYKVLASIALLKWTIRFTNENKGGISIHNRATMTKKIKTKQTDQYKKG